MQNSINVKTQEQYLCVCVLSKLSPAVMKTYTRRMYLKAPPPLHDSQ